jgi:hypothetical protein
MNESLPLSTPAAAGNAPAAAPFNQSNADTVTLDAHGHDPAKYEWVPVLRKRRVDGWSPSVQRRFIEILADTGSVEQAAFAVGKSPSSCYQLRRAPGAESFAAAWAAAIDEASKRLLDSAFERALVGSDEPVFNRDGDRVGRRFRQSDKLLMFLLRAYMPERFGGVTENGRVRADMAPPAPQPVAKALALLAPVQPAKVEQTMAPEQLEDSLLVADMMDGELPRRYRDLEPEGVINPMPLGEDFERQLEDAKRAGSGREPLSDAEWTRHRDRLLG